MRCGMREKRMAEGIEDQRLIVPTGERKPDNFTTEEVKDSAEIPELPPEPEVRKITGPENIPAKWAHRLREVGDGERILADVPRLAGTPCSPAIRLDLELVHHAQDALLVAFQVQGNAPVTVGWVLGQCSQDLVLQRQITLFEL